MSYWKGKRVLVTGSAGFIGSHLSERLVMEDANVRAFVRYNSQGGAGWLDDSPFRPDLEIVRSDIRDPGGVRNAVKGCDVVMHLCSLVGIPYSYHAPQSYYDTIEGGVTNVLVACRDLGVSKLVHTSTSEIYGTAQFVPISEEHPIRPQSPYADAKASADMKVASWHRSYGIPAIVVRPFNTFGERQSARAIVPTIIAQLLAGDTVRLGSLTPTRDLNYVANTVDGFLAAAACPEAVGRVVNIGSGREIAVGELALLIARLMGRTACVECDDQRVRPASSEVDRLVCDNRLARELLGWELRVGLEDGLMRTIEWMEQNAGRYRAHEYAV